MLEAQQRPVSSAVFPPQFRNDLSDSDSSASLELPSFSINVKPKTSENIDPQPDRLNATTSFSRQRRTRRPNRELDLSLTLDALVRATAHPTNVLPSRKRKPMLAVGASVFRTMDRNKLELACDRSQSRASEQRRRLALTPCGKFGGGAGRTRALELPTRKQREKENFGKQVGSKRLPKMLDQFLEIGRRACAARPIMDAIALRREIMAAWETNTKHVLEIENSLMYRPMQRQRGTCPISQKAAAYRRALKRFGRDSLGPSVRHGHKVSIISLSMYNSK